MPVSVFDIFVFVMIYHWPCDFSWVWCVLIMAVVVYLESSRCFVIYLRHRLRNDHWHDPLNVVIIMTSNESYDRRTVMNYCVMSLKHSICECATVIFRG